MRAANAKEASAGVTNWIKYASRRQGGHINSLAAKQSRSTASGMASRGLNRVLQYPELRRDRVAGKAVEV